MGSRFRSRRRTLHQAWLAVFAALSACGGGVFDAYRAAHPGWRPALPDAPGGLEELVAALHAPDAVSGIRVELALLAIFEVGSEPWRALDPAAVSGAKATSGSAYAVIAQRRCRASAGLEVHEVSRVDSYLVFGGRVEGYSHSDFRARCATRDRFRAARADHAALEHAVTGWIQKRYGRRTLEAAELYQRGLGYVEAGRMTEAEALLHLGDRGYRAGQIEGHRSGGAGDSQAEVEYLRAKLRRALSLEARKP